jgi:hypothetical protein
MELVALRHTVLHGYCFYRIFITKKLSGFTLDLENWQMLSHKVASYVALTPYLFF